MTDAASNAAFWHGKWERGETGFHEPDVNPLLTRHLKVLGLQPGARIFVPLCGKSLDMAWLAAQGYRVIGCELSEIAVRQFFEDCDLVPAERQVGSLRRFDGGGICVFAGNIFDLLPDMLGPVDAVYDRAALIALPDNLRRAYVTHMLSLTRAAPELLITLDYDQSCLKGPPFSVDETFLRDCYGQTCTLTCLEQRNVEGGLKGRCPASENVWLLQPCPTA